MMFYALLLYCKSLPEKSHFTWKRYESPIELLRQKTKSFFGCSGTACAILFSAQMACLGTLV